MVSVFNGYGMKRWDRKSCSYGFANKVYIKGNAYTNGMSYFFRSGHFAVAVGYITSPIKGGFYFSDSAETADDGKLRCKLFIGRMFIDFKPPKWMVQRQLRKEEKQQQEFADNNPFAE